MEKYLFLNPTDVISADNYPNCDRFLYANKKTLENLIRIVEETQCKIVIVSDSSHQLNSRGGDWTVVLNSQWLQMGYPRQINFFSATPVLWVADLKDLSCPVKSWKRNMRNPRMVYKYPYGLASMQTMMISTLLSREVKEADF